jgi:hypothetical protein
VIVGKNINADELSAYRVANSDSFLEWAKKVLKIGSGVVTVAFLFYGIGSLSRGGRKTLN